MLINPDFIKTETAGKVILELLQNGKPLVCQERNTSLQITLAFNTTIHSHKKIKHKQNARNTLLITVLKKAGWMRFKGMESIPKFRFSRELFRFQNFKTGDDHQ